MSQSVKDIFYHALLARVDGYDGIIFKEKEKKSHVTKNKKSHAYY